eukprot:NODE_686_length_4746_cov_0.370562.p1 type:complete len:359 gc:universal NODE_686_length_4746_cov_0.370562:2442-3518(+)
MIHLQIVFSALTAFQSIQSAATTAFVNHPLHRIPPPIKSRRVRCHDLDCKLVTKPAQTWGPSRVSHRDLNLANQDIYTYPEEAGEGTVVYTLDSGFNPGIDDYEYPVEAYDFTESSPFDHQGHGTYVAAIIAGKNHGVAPKARLKSLKVIGGKQKNNEIKALQFILKDMKEHKMKVVINMSIGYDYLPDEPNDEPENTVEAKAPKEPKEPINFKGMVDLLNQLVDLGAVVVKAAGNENVLAYSRESADQINAMENVLVVGSIDQDNTVSSFSNYGPKVALFAPGGYHTFKDGLFNVIKRTSGTSFAAPYVSGIAALYFSIGKEGVREEILRNAHMDIIKGELKESPNRLANNTPRDYQ